MKSLSLLTLLAIFGIAAAASFFRPAAPHQVPNAVPRGGADFVTNGAFDDADLDNPLIEADGNIHAARKCGFCMGFVAPPGGVRGGDVLQMGVRIA
eukprot:scaffold231416_cov48-Attheya_sp.AAC.1